MMKPSTCMAQSRLSRKAATPVLRARPGQRAVVRPMAQLPQRPIGTHVTDVEHRVDRLLGLADEFVHHWIDGVKNGPTEKVVRALNTVTATEFQLQSVRPLGKDEFKGMDGLRDMLTLEANREGSMLPTRMAIAAADEHDDVIFALMEGEATMRGPLTSEQKREGGDLYHHRGYGLVKFDTLLDDTACCVTTLNERWQLSPADVALLASALPFPVGETPETDDKETALKKTLSQSGAELFPKDRVKAIPFDREQARKSMEAWCEARCTGKDEVGLLQHAFDQTQLRTWDIMGVLPIVCGMKRGKEHGSSPTETIFSYAGTLDLVRDAKAGNDINCSMIDGAVSRDYNVGFLHWKSHVSPRGQGAGTGHADHVLEGLDMHVFNAEGKITDIWMLRDPTKPEQDLLSKALGPKAAHMPHMRAHQG